MFQWWRRLMEMPDRERARALAKLAFWFVMIVLYMLGGISLYLRARYLSPESTVVAPTAAVVVSPTVETTEPPTAFPTATSLPT